MVPVDVFVLAFALTGVIPSIIAAYYARKASRHIDKVVRELGVYADRVSRNGNPTDSSGTSV